MKEEFLLRIRSFFSDLVPAITFPLSNGLKENNAYQNALTVFNDFLKLDITGYYTILKNAMVRRDFQINGLDSIMYDGELSQVQAMQNAADAIEDRLEGIAAEWPHTPLERD